jgi:hypothetical protein
MKMDPLDGAQDVKMVAVVSAVADLFMWSEELEVMLEDFMTPLIGVSLDERLVLYKACSGITWRRFIVRHTSGGYQIRIKPVLRKPLIPIRGGA